MKRHSYLLLCALLLPVGAAAVDYTYDPLDRLKRVGYEDGRSIAYDYDAAGNLLKVTSVAQPSWCNQTVNFDGNVLPSNWSLALVRSGPGIRNNRLESQVTDSGSRIDAAAVVMDPGVGRIVVEYRALHIPSTWGIVSGIEFVDPAVGRWGFWLDNSTYHYPQPDEFPRGTRRHAFR
jgi:YD repeat-containing protein